MGRRRRKRKRRRRGRGKGGGKQEGRAQKLKRTQESNGKIPHWMNMEQYTY